MARIPNSGPKSREKYCLILCFLKSFITGLLTNVLNPKALIFFITVFTIVITQETNLVIKILLGVYMSVATFIWFVCVSLFLTHKVAINLFHSAVPWIERITGILLLGISIQIILQQL